MKKEKLIGGQDWQLEIKYAINESDYFVPCLSSHFQSRTFGHKEINLAIEVLDTMPQGAIYLIPVRLEDCGIDDRLAGRHCIDLFEAGGYEKLVKALLWEKETKKNARYNDKKDKMADDFESGKNLAIAITALTGVVWALNVLDAGIAGVQSKNKINLYFSAMPTGLSHWGLAYSF